MEGYIAQVILFAGTFAPRNWAYCQGQIMSISQNTALFSLLGTTYGGNGQTTFALPDLRGRVPVGAGSGPGLSPYVLGEVTGTENVTLSINQLPGHAHPFNVPANGSDSGVAKPGNAFLGKSDQNIYASTSDGTVMGPANTGLAGGSQPTPIIQPVLCLNYVICLYGIFPSRN
jgi:microcystin-dependent protein